MKIETTRAQLMAALKTATKVAPQRTTKPILSYVSLYTEDDSLLVGATDLHTEVRVRVDGNGGADEGAMCIHAKDLADRIDAMPEGPVEIAVKDTTAIITAPGSRRRFQLPTMDHGSFPALHETKRDDWSTFGKEIAGLLGKVIAAVSTDESRPHLNSVATFWSEGKLLAAATDGHRLHLASMACDHCEEDGEHLLPRPFAKRIFEMAKGSDEVKLCTTPGRLFAHAGDTQFCGLLVDSSFPPFEGIVPDSTQSKHVVDRAELRRAVQAVSVAAHKGHVQLTLRPDAIELSCAGDAGGGHDIVEAERVDGTGDGQVIGMNATYLLDALAAVDTDTVTLGAGGETDPVVVRRGATRASDGELTCVLMPRMVKR